MTGPGDVHVADPASALGGGDRALVDLVDGLLDHGVVVRAELWLSVADVDLVFVGADLVLSNPDRMRAGSERTP